MFEKFTSAIKDTVATTLVEKLHAKGINIDVETVKSAIEKSPGLVIQIQAIVNSDSKTKIGDIVNLIRETAAGEQSSKTPPTQPR